MNKETGGSAFPVTSHPNGGPVDNGMTLRDYFAAKAMAALMPVYWEIQNEYEGSESLIKCQVETAYEYADAMLKERYK